ncbi:unnamed protein product [Caenorhabditis sp. 36 PRJEB53466]|nr:unnamed protein product [Caenorhabditis sp. 36 PRJEB53466]
MESRFGGFSVKFQKPKVSATIMNFFALPLLLVVLGSVPSGWAAREAAQEMKKLLGDSTLLINTTQASVLELSNHWIDQAFSSLIATVANEKIATISHLETKFHEKCVKNVKSIEEHAKCVSDLLQVSKSQVSRQEGVKKLLNAISENASASAWVGAFRIRKKRQTVVRRSGYTLRSRKDDVSPFTAITKQITKTIRALKNKTEEKSWREIIVDVKKTGEVIEKRKKVKEMIGKSVRSRAAMSPRKPLAIENTEDSMEMENDDPIQMKNESENKQKIDLDKIFRRIQDHPEQLLTDEAPKMLNMSGPGTEAVMRIKLIREAVKLGLSLGGQNVSGFEQKSLRFASPRFFAIAPEEHKKDNDTINVLSPSLFSLHDEGSPDEQKLSIPSLFGEKIVGKQGGLGGEKDSFMDLLTEITGVADTVDDAARQVALKSEGILMNAKGDEINVSRENVTRIYGEENYRKMKVLEQLHGMYTDEQMEHFNTTGYAIMNDKQREMVYGVGAPFDNKYAMEAGRNLTMADARKALHTVIHEIGKGNMKIGKYEKRMKDIVGSPILFSSIIASPATASQAIILSPVLFTPLVFVPVILAPRIFAPIIVSPAIFSPIVLSPLAFDPLILVPGIANPLVLSPFIFTPFVLSPQVMTPLILSPFALSPFILTPTALSPVILSPFVLSPSVLSPSFVTAVVLSPYALSPSILSPPTMISVFASPSILS